MKNRVRLFGEIQKVEPQDDGTLKVSGIASSESVDASGEVVRAEAMKAAIPDYMKFGAVREMHQPIAAGTALAIDVDEAGVTHFEAHVVDPTSVKKVEAGVLKGFSIGGKVLSRDNANKSIITGLKLTEISLVDVPCNPDATFSLVKFEEGAMPDEEKIHMPEVTAGEEVKKGLYSVQDFAGLLRQAGWIAQDAQCEAEMEGDASAVPAKLREWLTAGAAIFQEMAAEEVQEMLASLAPKTPAVEMIEAAAGTDGLEKKLSASKQKAMQDAHDQMTALHKSMGDCMDKMAGIWKGDDAVAMAEPAGDLAKAQVDELATKLTAATADIEKVRAEKDSLQKTIEALGEDLKKAQAEAADLKAKLETKGATKAVPVEKGADSKKLSGETADPLDSSDPLAVMKAAQARPVSVFHNPRPAHLG